MDRAGRAVAWEVRRLARRRATGAARCVVCGKGNNGGDGLVAARVLAQLGRARATSSSSRSGSTASRSRARSARADVAIDAMYGTGFRGALEGDAAWCRRRARRLGRSRDLGRHPVRSRRPHRRGLRDRRCTPTRPSPSRRASRACVRAGSLARRGGAGRRHRHRPRADGAAPAAVAADRILDAADVRGCSRRAVRRAQVGVGGDGRRRLGRHDGRAAAREPRARCAPARESCSAASRAPMRRGTPRAREVITRALPATRRRRARHRSRRRGARRHRTLRRARARTRARIARRRRSTPCATLVARGAVPLVLDADGLNALAGDLEPLAARGRRRPRHGPHPARRRVRAPRWGTRSATTGSPRPRPCRPRSGAVVLLKGPDTVIAEPARDGRMARIALNPTGTPRSRRAGTGDVLTGVVAAFAARGCPPFEAAAAAAWVHGRAAGLVGPGRRGDVVGSTRSTLRRRRLERP